MYPKIARGVLKFVALGIGFGAGNMADAQEEDPSVVEQTPIGGNQTAAIVLPVQAGGMAASYYRFNVDGTGFTWGLTNVTYDPNTTRTGKTNSLGGSPLTLSVTTSGLAITGPNPTSQYIDFAPCTGPVNEFCNWAGALRYRFKIDPTLTVSPATTIGTDDSSVRTVQLIWPNALSGVTVTANCEVTSNVTPAPTITVSPASATTNSSSQANFTITTSGLRRIGPSGSGVPSGRCTFRAHPGSANVAEVSVLGQLVSPVPVVSPGTDDVPSSGSTSVDRTLTINTQPIAANADIDVNCTSAGTQARVSFVETTSPPASASTVIHTNASGQAQVRVISSSLVSTASPVPGISCGFTILGMGSTGFTYKANGKKITPSVSLGTAEITQAGTTPLTATMSPAYPGFTIVPSCTTNQYIPAVTATPKATSTSTNASGQQTFDVVAPALVIADPNTNAIPSASCTFRVDGAAATTLLQFRTGNACAMSLSPPPPACGNPVQ